jgi:site-specific recombinase XerD
VENQIESWEHDARCPLDDYLRHIGRDSKGNYVFASRRYAQLTDASIHHWFRILKHCAIKEQLELIADLSFHDVLHDFAHRAREAGWNMKVITYYLGYVTVKVTPVIQTTIRYTW